MKESLQDFFKDYIYIILGVCCIVLVGVIYLFAQRSNTVRIISPEDVIYSSTTAYVQTPAPVVIPEEPVIEDTTTEDPAEYIIVHIVGAVANPGVFTLPSGSRASDALALAGGGTIEADLARINLAAVVQDGMQIRIPAFGEEIIPEAHAETAIPSTATPQPNDGLININTATAAELQTLPGIGPVIANNIIEFRENNGNFTNIEALTNVSRIGPGTLANIRDFIRV